MLMNGFFSVPCLFPMQIVGNRVFLWPNNFERTILIDVALPCISFTKCHTSNFISSVKSLINFKLQGSKLFLLKSHIWVFQINFQFASLLENSLSLLESFLRIKKCLHEVVSNTSYYPFLTFKNNIFSSVDTPQNWIRYKLRKCWFESLLAGS